MAFKNIGKRLYIEPEGFGDYAPEIVEPILAKIAEDMSSLIDTPANDKDVYIMYANHANHPECCSCELGRIIFLHVSGNYWCKWAYQFAHEYLHHIIDGSMTGVIEGTIWFEEALCELSSMYHLYRMIDVCARHSNPILQRYAPAVQGYLNALLESNQDLKLELQSNGGLWQWLPLLSEPTYHRDHYNAIACRILPCFLENPNLWRMCSHIGDSHSHRLVRMLLAKLLLKADDSYRRALEIMCHLLFP